MAFPTETVYGVAADAANLAAVRRVYRIKGRPEDHPVIVHLGEAAALDRWARTIPPAARTLAARFWPGPLTLVLERSKLASDAVTGGQDTVALRVPAHPVAHAILLGFGGGAIAPSANRFGGVSATTAEHVVDDLDGAVDLIVDGGPAQIGVESTIVDAAHGTPRILRHGGISREQLEAALGSAVLEGDGSVRASGTLPSHYAPRASVEIVGTPAAREARAQALHASGKAVASIGDPSEPVETFARELYARLRRADEEGADVIVVLTPPEEGLGRAIADRLRRAAAPRV